MVGTFLQISIRVETIWLGELSLMMVDSPNVTLDPGSSWDEPALNGRIRSARSKLGAYNCIASRVVTVVKLLFTLSIVIPYNNHP
jgi:hypothetical protein